MTEKQINKIKELIKRNRAILVAEKKKFGGYDDSAGRRYYISDLYLQIADYSGALVYKKWFDKNFPEDGGSPIISSNWAIAFHSQGLVKDCKIYTIDTAFQNVYFHGLLLDREVKLIEMYDPYGNEMLEHTKSMVKDYKRIVTKVYIDWLSEFIESNEYKVQVNKFISLLKLLAIETESKKRIVILNRIRELEKLNLKTK
jgi:hypothetical protein